MPILTNGAGKIAYVMQNNEVKTLSLTNWKNIFQID